MIPYLLSSVSINGSSKLANFFNRKWFRRIKKYSFFFFFCGRLSDHSGTIPGIYLGTKEKHQSVYRKRKHGLIIRSIKRKKRKNENNRNGKNEKCRRIEKRPHDKEYRPHPDKPHNLLHRERSGDFVFNINELRDIGKHRKNTDNSLSGKKQTRQNENTS